MRLTRILLPLVVIVALIAGWSWWTSDAQRIARRFEALTREVAKRPGEGKLATAFKAEQFAGYFADRFRFRARQFDFETDDRATLTRAVAAYRLRSDRIAPAILHRELIVDPGSRKARMEVVVRFAGGFGSGAAEAYRFRLGWTVEQGRWRLEDVDLIEIVSASIL